MDTASQTPPTKYNPIGIRTYIFISLFGILLPLGTIGFELVTRICTEVIFNPLPSWPHLILVTGVPIAILWATLNIRSHCPNPSIIRLLMGMAFAISLVYTIRLLPFLPFSVMGIIVYGLGLVPMAPVFTLIASMILALRANEIAKESRPPPQSFKRGLTIGLVAFFVFSFSNIVTWSTLAWYSAEDEFPNRGVKILRWFGSDNGLRSHCYFENGDVWLTLKPATFPRAAECREIYYRVTGNEFSQDGFPQFPFSQFHQEGRRWDTFRGTLSVGHILPNLYLQESRIDGFVEMDGHLGYMEWTQEFVNNAGEQAEARCVIELPEGGVVSRATLWINGEEKEAAFGGRNQTIQAYQRVVSVRRDPLLITSAGNGHVRVQCFPIAPDGGTMRIKMGITFPTSPTHPSSSQFRLPRFVEQNFRIKPQVKHAVWMESKSHWKSEGKQDNQKNVQSDTFMLRRELAAHALSEDIQTLHINHKHGPDSKYYYPLNDREVILATFEQTHSHPEKWVLVLDGSRTGAKLKKKIRNVLADNNHAEITEIIIAHDEMEVIKHPKENNWKWPDSGGQDNIEALLRAIEITEGSKDTGILWIHGNQPAHTLGLSRIQQFRDRMGQLPELYHLPLEFGSNHVGQKFESFWKMNRVPLLANNPAEDLNHFFDSLGGKAAAPFLHLEKVEHTNPLLGASKTTNHLERLWAKEEVDRLLYQIEPSPQEAQELAVRSRLITPVSGAVVLETQEQYDRAQ